MSHLSASSVKDDPHTLSQIKIFNNLVDGISCKKSLSNSGAVLICLRLNMILFGRNGYIWWKI